MNGTSVDLPAFRGLVELHARSKTSGVVVGGTTGEGSTLSDDEHASLVRTAIEVAGGRLLVIASAGTNDTAHSVRLARQAAYLGADGLLAVTPYYNKPTPRGLLAHFGAIAEASDLPVILYNVPGRTGTDLTPDTVRTLVEQHPTVVAIKEASDRILRVKELATIEGLEVLCGEDAVLGEFLRYGAVGTISVLANIAPDAVAEVVERGGDMELERRLAPLARALFLESNPIPLKGALASLGWMRSDLRLPLVPWDERTSREVAAAIERSADLLLDKSVVETP